MIRKFLIINFFIFFTQNLFSLNYEYKSDNSFIDLKFDGNQISQIKFEFLNNNQKNFGIIEFNKEEINIILNTNIISFDEFKKFFPKPQNNQKLSKKIIFSWDIGELIVSDNYSLFSNKLEFSYDKGFEALTFFDSKKDFEFSILPNMDGHKQIYISSRNAGQFFYAQKISKDMLGGVLIGKGSFRKFDDYDLTIKVKDFSIDKEAKFYNLILTSRLLDVFSLLQNKQNQFNYLEVPVQKKGKIFNIDHALMLGGTVAFSFKGEANPSQKTAKINGTYGPLYLFEKNFSKVPFLNELFGKNIEESLLAADFKVIKNDNKTDFIFNPLSILTPGKARNFFDIWE
jgi:hypothetical protein